MPLTPSERKEAMPHGGQRRAAKRARVSETYVTLVMGGVARVSTPRGLRTLVRVQRAIAREMGRPVDEVFEPAQLARLEGAA